MKFSIIIPVYNVERYLKDCIQSVLKQKYKDYEIILVDDGSSDNSSQICDNYVNSYKNIHVIHQENQGLSAARNRGITLAKGEYIIFLDSDDVIADEECFTIMSNLASDVDLITFNMYTFFDGNAQKYPMHITDGLKAVYNTGIEYLLDALKKNINYKWYAVGCIYKAAFWRRNNFCYPVGYKYEDICTTYKIFLSAEKTVTSNKFFYGYRKDRLGAITQSPSRSALLDKLNLTENAAIDIKSRTNLPKELQNMLCANMSCSYYEVLIRSGMLIPKDKQIILQRLKSSRFLAVYATNYDNRYRLINILINSIGFTATSNILNLRRKLKLIYKKY